MSEYFAGAPSFVLEVGTSCSTPAVYLELVLYLSVLLDGSV
jgi:hypothetical protein